MPDLEPLRADHAPALLAFERENRAYFAASIPDRGDEYFTDFAARHAELLSYQAAGTDFLHVLVDNGEIIGRVNLVEAADGVASLGYRMAEKVTGRRLAQAAVKRVLVLAATEYGIKRVKAMATVDNPASRRVLSRTGFVETGTTEVNGKPAVTYERELDDLG